MFLLPLNFNQCRNTSYQFYHVINKESKSRYRHLYWCIKMACVIKHYSLQQLCVKNNFSWEFIFLHGLHYFSAATICSMNWLQVRYIIFSDTDFLFPWRYIAAEMMSRWSKKHAVSYIASTSEARKFHQTSNEKGKILLHQYFKSDGNRSKLWHLRE